MYQVAILGTALVLALVVVLGATGLPPRRGDRTLGAAFCVWFGAGALIGLGQSAAIWAEGWTLGLLSGLVVLLVLVGVLAQGYVVRRVHARWAQMLLDSWLFAGAIAIPLLSVVYLVGGQVLAPISMLAACYAIWTVVVTALAVPYVRLGRSSAVGLFVFVGFQAVAVGVVYLRDQIGSTVTADIALGASLVAYVGAVVMATGRQGFRVAPDRALETGYPDQGPSLAVVLSSAVTFVLAALLVQVPALAILVLCLSCVLGLVVRQMLIAAQNEKLVAHLAARERYFRSLAADTRDILIICSPAGIIEYASSAAVDVFGLDSEGLVGRHISATLNIGRQAYADLAEQILQTGAEVTVDLSLTSDRGAMDLEALASAQAGKVLLKVRDLTDRSQLREQLSYIANHDLSTELLNRRGINQVLARTLRSPRAKDRPPAVLFLDLDGFKRVNDAAGHDVGDRLLQAVADRLRVVLPSGCVLGRYGGDEFVVIVSDATADDPLALTRTIINAIKEPYVWSSHEFVLGASVGITVAGSDSQADSMVRFADMAMYEAKKKRLGYAFFEPGMLTAVKEQAKADFALTEAFESGRMHLLYQPIVDLATSKVVKVEGLLRWIDTDGIEQRPLDLVEFMERTGRGPALSRWVIGEAVRQQVVWRSHGHDVQVAVNLSPDEFIDPTLLEFIDEMIALHGIPPGALELEVTERVMISDPARAIDAMAALRSRGLHVAVDDFGTGFSSLRYLLELPLDTLKLDRAFVTQVSTGQTAKSIVQGIVTIGRELRLNVVAEGIEAQEQRDLVAEMGCHQGQGYLFSSELPATELETLFELQAAAALDSAI